MTLRRVILYQNGIGYFERTGHVTGQAMRLGFARGELDDVLKTLTVVDRLGAGVATVDVPTQARGDTLELGVRLAAGRVHDVTVGYAVPTPTWKAAYRVVIGDDHPGSAGRDRDGLLQAWAMVNNASQEDWSGVQLTLATGAPISFALDLHTPQYVSRPDATGHLVAPTVTAPLDPVTATATDRDGDGIPDVDDKCPDEPETYNGFDDLDGCPDHGRVIVTDSSVMILEPIRFAKGAGTLDASALPIIDAVAKTLAANPEIVQIEIGGNASGDEVDPWGLATRRANAVRDALVERGIDARRLVVTPYGATQPIGAADRDRRVDFVILKRAEGERAPAALTPQTMATTAHTATKPVDIAGSVRFVLTEPVSIRRGGSSMVSILNAPIDAADVYLWRPDANAPGSDRHPYRAVKLANTSGYTLEPGPIAIFARGSFVGDSLLGRLALGEITWVPYAIDGATTVTATRAADERPLRIVAVHHGVASVEAAAVRTTTYKIDAGREPAATIYLRHGKAAGFVARDLPPGTIDQGDAYVIPLPLAPGKSSVLVVDEREPVQRTIELLDARGTGLAAYVEGSDLPAGTLAAVQAAIALREDSARVEAQAVSLRARIRDLATRAEEIRQSLRTLEHVASADDLRKKLVASLAATTVEADALARQLAERGEALATAHAKLQDAIRELGE
jgi:outer membrane protein OmpA-like peptidoglycan-associated protein